MQTVTGPGAGTPVSHVFTDTGTYIIQVQAADKAGNITTVQATITARSLSIRRVSP